MDAGEINLLDPLVFEDKVPHEWFTWLRHNAPVFRHPEPGGPGFWVITRYDDVVEVGRDGVTYSSEQSRGGVVALEDTEAAADISAQGRMMLTMDAPDHTRYRSLVNRGFTPRMINALSTSHPRDGDEDSRAGARKARLRFRHRRCRGASAAGDRRDAGRAVRRSAQALRMEQPHDRQQGSRVRGQPGEGPAGGDRDVHVLERACEEAARGSARRYRHRAAQSRPRRRQALRDGLQRILPAARGGRQRDDAQRDVARHACADRASRSVRDARRTIPRWCRRQPRKSCAGRRR